MILKMIVHIIGMICVSPVIGIVIMCLTTSRWELEHEEDMLVKRWIGFTILSALTGIGWILLS